MNYKHKKEKVEQALEEYLKFKERAEKITAAMTESASRSNMSSDKVGNNVAAMVDLDIEYWNRWIEAERERLELTDKINLVKIEPHRTILFMYYVQEMSFEDIAATKKRSYTWVSHYHSEALKEFEKV